MTLITTVEDYKKGPLDAMYERGYFEAVSKVFWICSKHIKHGKWLEKEPKCLVCLSIDAEKKQRIRDSYTLEQRKAASIQRGVRAKLVQDERRSQGLCPYCGRKVKPDQKQCDFCRARKRTSQERFRRKHGVVPKQIMCEDETVCSTCEKPVKAGFKVCENCYSHCVDMGQTGRANRKTHYWEKDNRIVFLENR